MRVLTAAAALAINVGIAAIAAQAAGSAPGARLAAASAGKVVKPGAAPKPGEYIADGGWGWLEISVTDRDGTQFTLESVGANAHMCNLDGRIRAGKATLETSEGEPSCVVTFAARANGVEISSNDACRNFCGARASFDGTYLRPPAGCTSAGKKTARESFKRLYDGKRYAEALTKLEPIPSACASTLYWIERGELLNDIAITQYKIGRSADCLRTLASLQEEAAMSDEEVLESYPPADGESWLPVIKAARFNLGLCRKKPR